MSHPKYTLVLTRDFYEPYVIMEHADLVPDPENKGVGIASRKYKGFKRLDDALMELSMISTGPIVIAASAQEIDNTFTV